MIAFSFQSAARFISKCKKYYTKWDRVITKCDDNTKSDSTDTAKPKVDMSISCVIVSSTWN